MPGSPPIRMAEPATMPPPQTRSNSSLPLRQRGSSIVAAARSVKAMARPPPALAPPNAFGTASTTSSTRVFHSPQESQRPAQRL